MKIAFLSTFYPYRGGIAQFNASLYRALEKEHEVKAFTFTRQYPDLLFPGETQLVTDKDKVDPIPADRVLDSINPFSYLSAGSKVKDFKPDVLIMKYWMSFLAPALGTVAGKLKGKTKVISVLDNVIPHEKRFFDTAFTKYFLNRNDGFVLMSEAVKADLLKLIPKAKWIFHPHPLYDHFGAATDKFTSRKALGIPEDKKAILFFGFIRDYKGLDLLIEAISNLNEDHVLIIAGEVYGSFDKYDQQIKSLHLENRIIRHVRYIGDDEVPQFFSAADVCVLPYKSATQSGITSIAWHFNLPLIATDTGGLKESIHHNETGLIVEKPEAGLIAAALQDYFQNEKRQLFASEMNQRKEQLSWDHLAKAISDFAKTL